MTKLIWVVFMITPVSEKPIDKFSTEAECRYEARQYNIGLFRDEVFMCRKVSK